ncbi:E3 ubiquitin-protein ligase TRIM65 [Discoglossus pictus]
MSGSAMSRDSLRDNLNCCICLEYFTSPLTLPCGHNFCQKCIHDYWGREELQPSPAFTCPECRKVFPQRPEPCRNVNLYAVVEHLKEKEEQLRTATRQASEGSALVCGTLCPRHRRALDMFCCTDNRCICRECSVKDCCAHQLELIEDRRKQQEEHLRQTLKTSTNQKKQTEEVISRREQDVQNIKDSWEKMLSGIGAQFDQLSKALEECRSLTVQAMKREQVVALEKADDGLGNLRSYLMALEKHKQEAEQLLQNPDDAAFLQGLALLTLPGSAPIMPVVPSCVSAHADAVNLKLPEALRLFQMELPNALYPSVPDKEVKESSEAASSTSEKPQRSTDLYPMSELRKQLSTEYCDLTFDPKTPCKYIKLSRENCKATHKVQLPERGVPELPERFHTWQVMCTEGFSQGHHYWEVEISDFFVHIGVAYESLPRAKAEENKIGRNRLSWSLQVLRGRHSAWHNNKEIQLQAPEYRRIGVSLHCDKGNLTFYGIKDGKLERLHSFTCLFSDKVYPVFWIGETVTVRLCQKTELPNSDVDIYT